MSALPLRRAPLAALLLAAALVAPRPAAAQVQAADLAIAKTCGPVTVQPNGDLAADCAISLSADAWSGAALGDLNFAIEDLLTDASGTAQPGWIAAAPGCTPAGDGQSWRCGVPSLLWQGTNPGAVTLPIATVSLVIPAGTEGPLQNCARLRMLAGLPVAGPDGQMPDLPMIDEACVTLELPQDQTPDIPTGAQCAVFTPEVTCDPATGLPVVTLTNSYSSLFPAGSVHLSALTPGVTLTPGSGPMSVVLTGANPGDTVHLFSEAVAPGAGSAPGLDLCCMGDIAVTIPRDLQCTPETVLEVKKRCEAESGATGPEAQCEIVVHYSGPPPSAATPLTVDDAVTGGGWSVAAYLGSSDNWSCDPTPHAGPAPWSCAITEADQPGTDWNNFTSSILVRMNTEGAFENCATATQGNAADQDCWSDIPPSITIAKTGPEQCDGEGPCDYQVTLTAGPGGYYGPVLLSDTPPAGFDITAVAPPVPGCATPADPLACLVSVGLAAGASQSYTLTIARDGSMDGLISGENCAALHGLAAGPAPTADEIAALLAADPLAEDCVPVVGVSDECPEGQTMVDGQCVATETPAYTLDKTCEHVIGAIDSLHCTITLTTNGVPFPGTITVADTASPALAGTISAPVGTCDSNALSCTFTAADLAGLTPPDTVQVTLDFPLPAGMPDPYRNCAEGKDDFAQGAQACWTPTETPETPAYTLDKTCEDQIGSGGWLVCTITLTTNGVPFEGEITVTDVPNPPASGVISSAYGACDSNTLSCTFTAAALAAATPPNTAQITVSIPLTAGKPDGIQNCAEGTDSFGQGAESCWTPSPETGTPAYTLEKTCEVGVRLLDCTITLTTNGVPFPGTIIVTDVPNPTAAGTISAPVGTCDDTTLSCSFTAADLNGLTPPFTVQISASVPLVGGLAEGFENCAEGTDPFEQGAESCWTPGTETGGTEEPAYTLAKTCTEGDPGIACTITVTTNGLPFAGTLTIQDEYNLATDPGAFLHANEGSCDNATMSCSFTDADFQGLNPPNTIVITVGMPGSSLTDGFMNCATGANETMGSARDCWANGNFDHPNDPPAPVASCSSDYIFVVDTSGSIGGNAGSVSSAVYNLARVLNGMGSQASVITFNTNAAVSQPMSAGTMASLATGGLPFAPSGATNWEAALTLAAGQATPTSTVIFITDGRPTAWLDSGGNVVVQPDGPTTWLTATNEAIPAVNALYGAGVPIIGIGIAGPGEGSFVSAYLDQLLGTPSISSTFGSVAGDAQTLALSLCADIHLTKLMDGQVYDAINFHNLTGPSHRITVTLRAQNTTGADMSNVVIDDVIPASLTNPGNESPAGAVTFAGQTATWTIPTLAAGATATVTYQVDIARPAANAGCVWQTNYAQVESLTGATQSTPGNMDPVNGPASEPDEASARFCAEDQPPPPPPEPCEGQWLEVRKTAVEESCFVGQPCEFTVTVRPQTCNGKGFDGVVNFADLLHLQGNNEPTGTPVQSITNSLGEQVCPFPEAWVDTALPTGCQTGVALAPNQTITFHVTVTAPAAGSYTQCFVADDLHLDVHPDTAVHATNPPTQPTMFIPRGNCVTVYVAEPPHVTTGDNGGGDTRATPAAPVLTLVKEPDGPCRTSERANQHQCGFAITVTNTGDAPYVGPLVLSDQVTGIVPTGGSLAASDGWSCDFRGASASCVNPALTLEPGQSTRLAVTLTLPGSRRAASFAQCAAIGVGPGADEQTLLAQRIMQIFGIDGGPVDGISGRQTRAGMRLLAERLGQPASDTLTPGMLGALGLGAAGAPSCVTVDLPAIQHATTPTNPTGGNATTDSSGPRCDARTTVRSGDRCECRAPGMVQLSATTCGCPEGSHLVGVLGCIRLELPVITLPRHGNNGP